MRKNFFESPFTRAFAAVIALGTFAAACGTDNKTTLPPQPTDVIERIEKSLPDMDGEPFNIDLHFLRNGLRVGHYSSDNRTALNASGVVLGPQHAEMYYRPIGGTWNFIEHKLTDGNVISPSFLTSVAACIGTTLKIGYVNDTLDDSSALNEITITDLQTDDVAGMIELDVEPNSPACLDPVLTVSDFKGWPEYPGLISA